MADSEKKTERNCLNALPFEVVDVDEETANKLKIPYWKFVLVGPKKYALPEVYRQHGLFLYNFEARPSDVYVMGFPRSGTTLHAEMVWQISNNLDYEAATKDLIHDRFPNVDFNLVTPTIDRSAADFFDKKLSERKNRFLQFHAPASLISPHIFEGDAKVIYCARNPKDVIVSCYYIEKFFQLQKSNDFYAFFQRFKNNLCIFCPYIEHVKEAWARRNDKNFLFIFYEDTMKDKKETMLRIAKLLGKDLSKDQQESLENYLDFDNFRKNKSVNFEFLVDLGLADGSPPFIRKGKPGNWREYFVGDLEKEVDEWIMENLKGTDLVFPDC